MSQHIKKLRFAANAMLATQHKFNESDLVVWKHKSLMDRRMPELDTPAIVLEVLDPPMLPRNNEMNEDGSHYTWAKLDIVIGIMDEDDQLRHFAVDSRRFKPYEE